MKRCEFRYVEYHRRPLGPSEASVAATITSNIETQCIRNIAANRLCMRNMLTHTTAVGNRPISVRVPIRRQFVVAVIETRKKLFVRATRMGKSIRAKSSKTLVKKDAGIAKTSQEKLEEMKRVIAVEPVSRGKRKRAVKKARLESRKEFVRTALRSKNSVESIASFGEALADFSELANAIDCESNDTPEKPEISSKPKKVKWLSGALKRGKKAEADALDINRYRALLSVPDFASDPLAAMEKHLLHAKQKREEKEALASRKTSTMDESK